MSSTQQELVNKFSTLFPSGSQADFDQLIDFSCQEKTDSELLKTAWNDLKTRYEKLKNISGSSADENISEQMRKIFENFDELIKLKGTNLRYLKISLVAKFSFLCESIDPNIESNRNSKSNISVCISSI